MKHFISSLFLLLALLPIATGCSDTTESLYAHERAFLRISPVTAIAPLYTALNSPGVFCTITIGTQNYNFKSSDGNTATYPFTALESYGEPECVAGFVVGISSVPDLNMQYEPVAYDLVCPSCYEDNLIQRSLSFSKAELLACPRCQRTYDLTNGGIESSGKGGSKLYRYHITYSSANNLLVVMN